MAVQRTGDLFSSTYDLYLGMVILHKKNFIDRVQALHQSTLAVPSSDGTHRVICERTRLILEAHTYGLTFLTLNRARMSWKDENFIVDWKYVRPSSLSQDDMDEWAIAAKHVASNLKFVDFKVISRI